MRSSVLRLLLCINDFQTCCRTLKYVDNSSVGKICVTNCHDSYFQVTAEQVKTWSSRNLMKINADKTNP